MFGIETDLFILLFICLLASFAFEFINGFHDTANAVATVIYTNSLKPTPAVLLSGLMNFLGVASVFLAFMPGGLGVGISIINLLPVELLVDQNIWHAFAMLMSILLTAIAWNFGTWYFGIPSSSSHTLIGSLLGISLGFVLLPGSKLGLDALNWNQAYRIFTGLLLAPIIGFSLAYVLLNLFKKLFTSKKGLALFKQPTRNAPPPLNIRLLLIGTSTLVSFFHGKNDGQKGIGLIMLTLIALLPSYFALKPAADIAQLRPQVIQLEQLISEAEPTNPIIKNLNKNIILLKEITSLEKIPNTKNIEIRSAILELSNGVKKANTQKLFPIANQTDINKLTILNEKGLRSFTDYAPLWVIVFVSLALGLGTIIGWKRIVKTVGEKIGKTHLTYAQGASAELVAAATIGLASGFGLPVSTTHTLSSGVAGTMVAQNGIKNLQMKTVKSIALAWVLTLPVTVILSAALFLLSRWLLG